MNKKEIKKLVRKYEENLKNAEPMDPMEPLDICFFDDPETEWEFKNKFKLLEGQKYAVCLNYNSKLYGHNQYYYRIAKEYIEN